MRPGLSEKSQGRSKSEHQGRGYKKQVSSVEAKKEGSVEMGEGEVGKIEEEMIAIIIKIGKAKGITQDERKSMS